MRKHVNKFAQVLSNPSHTRTLSLIVLLLIIAMIPLTVIVSQQRQDIRQRADSVKCYEDGDHSVGQQWDDCQGCTEGRVTCSASGSYDFTPIRQNSPSCGANCAPVAPTNAPAPTNGNDQGGRGGQCTGADNTRGSCRSWEFCVGGFCHSTQGCGRDSDCMPKSFCDGGTCRSGASNGKCQSAASLEARFSTQTGNDIHTTLAGIEIDVAVYRNRTGQLAGSLVNNEFQPTDVTATLSGPGVNQSIDVGRVNKFTPTQNGKYTISASCGNNVTGRSDLTVTGGTGTPPPTSPPSGAANTPTPSPISACTDNCSQSPNICQGISFNDACGHVCQGTKNCITPSPTPTLTNTPTPTLTPSPTPTPGNTILALNVSLSAIGNGQDQNPNPAHTQREFKIMIFDNTNRQLPEKRAILQYVPTTGTYQGTLNAGQVLTGNYMIEITAYSYLIKLVPGIQAITAGTTYTVAPVTLIAGDINADNKIDALDYQVYLSCFGSRASSAACGNNRISADLNDDGRIDTDINDAAYDKSDFKLLLQSFGRQGDEIK